MTVELREWRKLAVETAEELKIAQADVVLQSGLCEAVREKMSAQTIEMMELQEHLGAKSAELLQL